MGGGHLERGGRKVWFSTAGLMRGALAGELEGALNPAGHIKLFHRPASLYWRSRGFAVLEFTYDWRMGFDDAAARLREAVAALPPTQTIRIAAHSMGGCVACRFSALYPAEARRVERAYFFGVPVRGTFAAVEVLLGQFLLPRLVAGASVLRGRRKVLDELGAACSAMPGLADLLPDPELYPSAGILYSSGNWPRRCAPPQEMLDRARELKRRMPASPLLERTTVLAASLWPTPAAVELSGGVIRLSGEAAPGDGVTPFASAAAPVPGLRVCELRFPHAFLLFEPAGLRAVVAP